MSDRSVEVVSAAADQEPVLTRLVELYAYDLSDAFDLNIGPDGRYGYPSLPLYWKEESRLPFLVKVDGHLGGFVLISRGSLVGNGADVWDMAEFFVMKRYRRAGIGAKVAHEVWRRHPGPWEVRVVEANAAALIFWQRAISAFTGTAIVPVRVEQGGRQRFLFSFDSSLHPVR